jgi:cobalamin biosynthesis protein CobT
MAIFVDLFNPTFLIFLGIILLIVVFLFYYFENKMREQNHALSSMLSLVSTLAEDTNNIKLGLNHLAIKIGGNSTNNSDTVKHIPLESINLGNINSSDDINLIEVSDDDDDEDNEDEDEDNEDEDEDNEDEDEDNEDEDNEDEDEDEYDDEENVSENNNKQKNVKLIKLNIENDLENNNNLENINDIKEISPEYTKQILDLKYDEPEPIDITLEESNNSLLTNLKTISINLNDDENQHENIDFKKYSLQKLRSIVVEKSLISNSEAQKLKKNELLKLLNLE